MFLRVHAKKAAAQLRQQIPEVRRVLIAHTDGLPFHDDLADDLADDVTHARMEQHDSETASAVVAAMLGLSEHANSASAHGTLSSATVRSDEGCLSVYPVGERHALAVYAAPSVNLVLLDHLARQLATDLAAV